VRARLELVTRDKRHIHHKDTKSTKEKAEVVAEFARVLWGCLCVERGDAGVRGRGAGVICRVEGVICHVQGVICHVAGVICRAQGVICHVAGVICDRSCVIGPWVWHRAGIARPTCQRKGRFAGSIAFTSCLRAPVPSPSLASPRSSRPSRSTCILLSRRAQQVSLAGARAGRLHFVPPCPRACVPWLPP